MNRLKCNNILQIANWLRETSHKEQLFEEESSLRKDKLCSFCKPKVCTGANFRFVSKALQSKALLNFDLFHRRCSKPRQLPTASLVQTEGLHQCKPKVCKQSSALLSFAYNRRFVSKTKAEGSWKQSSALLSFAYKSTSLHRRCGAVARRGRRLMQIGDLQLQGLCKSPICNTKIVSKTLELQISDLHEPPAPCKPKVYKGNKGDNSKALPLNVRTPTVQIKSHSFAGFARAKPGGSCPQLRWFCKSKTRGQEALGFARAKLSKALQSKALPSFAPATPTPRFMQSGALQHQERKQNKRQLQGSCKAELCNTFGANTFGDSTKGENIKGANQSPCKPKVCMGQAVMRCKAELCIVLLTM